MRSKRKPNTDWMNCVTCGERVRPGEGTVVYPLPHEMRAKMPVSAALYTNGVRHKTCAAPQDAPLEGTMD